MQLEDKIKELANMTANPCVTISLNTHRTHPKTDADKILLKNLLSEAKKRILAEYDKRSVADLLEYIDSVEDEVDFSNNLESLHIFLSNSTKEIIRSAWAVPENIVSINTTYNIRPLIKALNRNKEYLILILSQGGVHLYKAVNDKIDTEVKNDNFPFNKTPYYLTNKEEKSDSKKVDDLIREFFNQVDKALLKVISDTGLTCIVISTEDNYIKLMQVAQRRDIYTGFTPINYNKVLPHNVVEQSWEVIKQQMAKDRIEAIAQMKEAISHNKVVTDLDEIYRAAIRGLGDMLIVYENFSQPVVMTGKETFSRVNDSTLPNVIEDITSLIAWEVISKGGKVFFTSQEEIKDLGEIVLKTKY